MSSRTIDSGLPMVAYRIRSLLIGTSAASFFQVKTTWPNAASLAGMFTDSPM